MGGRESRVGFGNELGRFGRGWGEDEDEDEEVKEDKTEDEKRPSSPTRHCICLNWDATLRNCFAIEQRRVPIEANAMTWLRSSAFVFSLLTGRR